MSNTDCTQPFFIVLLKKVSSAAGQPDVGWSLIVPEWAQQDRTNRDKRLGLV